MSVKRKRKGDLVNRSEYPLPKHQDAAAWITGVSVLPSGQIALADFNGQQVIVLSKHYRFSSSLKLSGCPWGVDTAGLDYIVVSMASATQLIHVIKINGTSDMEVINTIRTGFVCNGIVFTGEELVVTCPDDASVKMLDISGNVTWSVTKYGSRKSKSFYFYDPKYICANADNSRFVVSDPAMGVIVSIHRDSSVLNVVDVKDGRPMGLALTESGNILVCMNGRNEITEYTDGLTQRKVCGTLNDGIRLPQAICYNPDQDVFILSFAIGTVLVTYKLQN